MHSHRIGENRAKNVLAGIEKTKNIHTHTRTRAIFKKQLHIQCVFFNYKHIFPLSIDTATPQVSETAFTLGVLALVK